MENVLLPQGLVVDNRTNRDLAVAFELRQSPDGQVVALVIQEREHRSAAGIIVPRDSRPTRLS